MSKLHEPDPPGRTAAGATINAVLEQQRRLAAEFELARADANDLPELIGSFERLLCRILASVDWRGPQNRIFEALPHLGPIDSVRMLRTVLSRLDVRLIPIERRAADLSGDELPCLVVEGEEHCRLLAVGSEGTVEAHDLTGETGVEGDRAFRSGTVYLIRPDKADDGPGGKAFGGFVGDVLKRLRGPLTRIAGYSAAINILGLALSLYVLLVYDIIIATSSQDTLAFLAVGALICLAFELRLRHARSKTIAYLAARFDGTVSVRAFASVLSLPLSLTERAPLASQLSRLRQFEIGRDLFAGNLASAMFDLPFTLLFIILLFVIGGVLGFVPIGLSLVMVIVCVLTATVSIAQINKVGANKLRSDALLFELTDKLKTIRNASAELKWLSRYADRLATYQRSRFDNVQLGSHLQVITNGLVGLAGIVTLSVGALRVMDGAMSLGALIAAMMIIWRVLVPIQIVSLNIARLKQTLATVRQINEVVRIGTERERDATPTLSRRLNGNIFASGLYLSFGAQAEPQLRSVNLEIKAGEIVAIAGPSGAGKSTLLKAILGLYPQYMGTVRLDGLDLRQLHPAEVRATVGYASQQPTFFYGSVAANFRFASPSATDSDIMEALAAVGLSLPHAALPHGLATRITSTGSGSLSQGFLCRLSIARALVKKPTILLLDDPGNGLDRAGDAALIAHLDALRGKTTVLLVTARPSHMRAADRVIEMRAGMVVADGNPDTVIQKIMKQITSTAA
jgi:ATP-binding cassette, subfamily C, bacterial LapB